MADVHSPSGQESSTASPPAATKSVHDVSDRQQLNKSFICNVPLPHLSSFRCKRSNNFLNNRQKKKRKYLQNSNTTNNQWII